MALPLLPIWLGVKAFGSKLVAFAVSPVGRWVVGGIVVLALAWWAHSRIYAKGYEAATQVHAKAMAAAAAEVRKQAAVRDVLAAKVAAHWLKEAQEAQAKTQADTSKAVQVVTRYRDRFIPANCPTHLPPQVEDEGRKAVERANKAG